MKFFGRKTPPYLAVCEYWVYFPSAGMPRQDVVMAKMLRGDPKLDGCLPPVEPSEGLLFSDVRLHVALVMRSKNPHLFRPDLFDAHIEPTPQILEDLAAAQSLAKVRYLSEDVLCDDRQLQFVPRLAYTVASLGCGRVLFDTVAEKLMSLEYFHKDLQLFRRTDVPDFHVRVVWLPEDAGGRAATRGLIKVGLPELVTPVTRGDHEAIVREVLSLAAETLWQERRVLDSLSLKCYDDTFLVQIEPGRKGPLQARILRVSEP